MIEEFRIPNNLYVKWIDENMGWGVFTNSPIKYGEIVETCYCLVNKLSSSTFIDYKIKIDDNNPDLYLGLGFGSIYNHSSDPNMKCMVVDFNRNLMTFTAIKDIEIGEELSFNYGDNYWKNRNKKTLI